MGEKLDHVAARDYNARDDRGRLKYQAIFAHGR
jgi:hypothetical protein